MQSAHEGFRGNIPPSGSEPPTTSPSTPPPISPVLDDCRTAHLLELRAQSRGCVGSRTAASAGGARGPARGLSRTRRIACIDSSSTAWPTTFEPSRTQRFSTIRKSSARQERAKACSSGCPRTLH